MTVDWNHEWIQAQKRIRALEAFLVKVLPAGIEDACDECGGDLAKCKAENPDCYIAEARRLLPPQSETFGEHPGGGLCIHVWALTNRSAVENGKCELCGNTVYRAGKHG